jgi:hypothetical protein
MGVKEPAEAKRAPYRGDLNGAYRDWHKGGRPADPAHPLTKKLLSEANLYADRILRKEVYSLCLNHNKRTFHGQLSLDRVRDANERSVQRAIELYDPAHKDGASFTTYLKNAIEHNFTDEKRRARKPPHQRELLRAHNGDKEMAHWWIDEEIAEKDRPLAHWLLEQDPDLTITWRRVLVRFPEYKTEDRAQRALQRVKRAIEKAGFYRF